MAHRTVRAKRRRQRRVLTSALTWALVGLLVALAASSILGGPVRLVVVRGHSMDPTFATGDLVVVEAFTTPRVGDVVSYPIVAGDHEAHIVHRIVAEGSKGFVTRGDNRTTDDPWTPTAAQVDGRVALHISGIGRWLTGWLLPLGAAALAGIALTCALWPEGERRRAIGVS